MTNKLSYALALAKEGYHVFPLIEGDKLPAIEGFPTRATRDPEQIKRWWVDPVMGIPLDRNVGISTTRYDDNSALLVVDIDVKGSKHGDEEIKKLELAGQILPDTCTTVTPTGGRHLFYRVPVAVRQGANVLAPGVDIRSHGGYVVGAGSSLAIGPYKGSKHRTVADAPQWLIDRCGEKRPAQSRAPHPAPVAVDPERAEQRALAYLAEAPLALQEQGGDQTTYQVACRLKDLGATESDACRLLAEHWNDRCSPPWDYDELVRKVANAYRYGREAPGTAAPETQFPPVFTNSDQAGSVNSPDHPFEILNREYAFVLAGGGYHVLWETTDEKGRASLEHLSASAFHAKHAAWQMMVNKRSQPITELWMHHKSRRSYDGICFMPGEDAPPRFYNLWKGFAVEPLPVGEKPTPEQAQGLKDLLDHVRLNVCSKDETVFNWLMGYFAHMFQKPADKPLVALVFRGGKGVGKNFLIESIGHLLGNHFLLTSNRRYLVSNFNGHLENCLLFALDEAFWSGDKQAEGIMKDLITGKSHVVEHKGKESYVVDNRTRIAIIGNEDWLVPASHDERRFAAFDVGDGRKQDRTFFQTIRDRMENGGYRLLLRHLLDRDITGLDFNAAPDTAALRSQKHQSLEPVDQWWFECLTEGRIVKSDFDDDWPERVDTERFRAALERYYKSRHIHTRVPDASGFGRALAKCVPKVDRKRGARHGQKQGYDYVLPPLEECRAAWEQHIGHGVNWE